MGIKKKSKKLTVKGAKLGVKPKPRGYRLGENRARPEPRPERPKPRKIAKKGPAKTLN
jgi:hypothetical protein